MEHHLVNLLDLAVDMAADLGMGTDSRYGAIYRALVPILAETKWLADGQLTEDDGPSNDIEDFDEVPF